MSLIVNVDLYLSSGLLQIVFSYINELFSTLTGRRKSDKITSPSPLQWSSIQVSDEGDRMPRRWTGYFHVRGRLIRPCHQEFEQMALLLVKHLNNYRQYVLFFPLTYELSNHCYFSVRLSYDLKIKNQILQWVSSINISALCNFSRKLSFNLDPIP